MRLRNKKAKAYCSWHFCELNDFGVCPKCAMQDANRLSGHTEPKKSGNILTNHTTELCGEEEE